MIQRKQTLFLVLAIILSITCLCMPIGILEPVGMGTPTVLWNLGTVVQGSGVQFSNWPLFAFLAVSIVLEIIAIFTYHRRMLQAKLCSWSIVFSLACMLTLLLASSMVLEKHSPFISSSLLACL